MILDAGTLEQVPAVETILKDARRLELPGRLGTELFASVVELKTGICASAREAVGALGELRRAAAGIAERHGLRLAAAGTHPFTRPEEQPIVQKPRYLGFVEYAGVSARRQGVNGLHVHVGMPSADECFHAIEGVLPWLPLVLAVSANSPYVAGEETGLASNRAEILAQLPRSGAPPAFDSYSGWEAFVERLMALGVAPNYTVMWWDIRPHPAFGTLEIRMPDQQTSLTRTAALVALLQALSVFALHGPALPADPAARGLYQQNRWAALRFGPRARLIEPGGDSIADAPELGARLLALLRPVLAELGSAPLVESFDFGSCEGDQQLEIGRARGLEEVCRELVDRSLPSS